MREFKVNALDAVQLEKYENALAKMQQAQEFTGAKASEKIKHECNVIKQFFDDCFGPGAATDRFGDSYNYESHFNALADVIETTNNSIVGANNKMMARLSKYSAERAQRRV